MAFIYKIENDINDKLYVGQTGFSLEHRFAEHCCDAFHPRREKRPLYRAIRKYGKEHFRIVLLEETDNPDEREMFWIDKLGTYSNGYNATMGGEGKRSVDYDEIVRAYQTLRSQKKVAEALGVCLDTIRQALTMRGVKILTSTDISVERYGKSVDMYSLDGGFIQSFETLTAAASYLSKEKGVDIQKICPTHISEVCKGRRKTAYGYSWQFKSTDSFYSDNHLEKPVSMYSKSGELLRDFDSLGKAVAYISQTTGIAVDSGVKSHIAGVCRGLSRSAYGYIWKFKETGDNLAS